MFVTYEVDIKFRNQFAAGIPKNPEVLLDFLEAREPSKPPEGAIPIAELAEEIEGQLFEPEVSKEAKLTTTFKTINGGLVYEARCVKAHLKDCAGILAKGIEHVKGLKIIVANRVHVEPDYIPLMRNGRPIETPDGTEIRPITIMTRQGPRSAVKLVEYVNAPEISFRLVVLNDGAVGEGLLKDLFTYGGRIKGMGQDRGLGWGRYTYEIRQT